MGFTNTTIQDCLSALNTTKIYNCSNSFPDCLSSNGFQFPELWLITQAIYESCPNDTRLFEQTPFLTNDACILFTGRTSWTEYSTDGIWSRLSSWKLPLFQLAALFPRPPLSLLVEFFVIAHLMGDPISTIHNILRKFQSCYRRAVFWKDYIENKGLIDSILKDGEDVTQIWKGLAAIVDSFAEWGPEEGNKAEDFILNRLRGAEQLLPAALEQHNEDRLKFLQICLKTANSLAADRSTNFFPMIVAQFLFIGAIGIAFAHAKSAASGDNPTTFINVEAHSIGGSALFFWVIPAVFLGSVIGVSQTENAIPNILGAFSEEIRDKFQHWEERLPNDNHTPVFQQFKDLWLPFFVVTSGTIAGILVSYLVPPTGFDCRHIGIVLIYSAWILSSLLNYIPFPFNRSTHTIYFRLILLKDTVVALATLTGIFVGHVGVYNRCSCYTLWGRAGLALPQEPKVKEQLSYRIVWSYPAVSFVCIGFQLVVVPMMIVWKYELAVRVFLRKDNGNSNLGFLKSMMGLLHVIINGMRGLCLRIFQRGNRRVEEEEGYIMTSRLTEIESNKGLDFSREARSEKGDKNRVSGEVDEVGDDDVRLTEIRNLALS